VPPPSTLALARFVFAALFLVLLFVARFFPFRGGIALLLRMLD